MKVALYHPWVYLRSGLERTILELTGRSRHDWTIFTSHFDREGTYPEFKNRRVVELRRVPVERRYSRIASAALTILRQELDLAPFDALVVSCEGLGDLILFRNGGCPAFCLCFTPLRAAFDPEYQARHLATAGAWRRAVYGVLRPAFVALDRWAWRRYRHVFCISREVRERAVRGNLVPAGPMEVIYPGVDPDYWKPSGEREPYFLVPGRIMWTKNLELAIEAYRLIPSRASGSFRLVIAGMVDRKSEPYYARLRRLGQEAPGIEFVVAPSDAELLRLYQRCWAVLFPAFNEDWGIVPLEAMACGKPIIAVNRGGPTESVRDGTTGVLVPARPRDFADAMDRMTTHPGLVDRMGRLARAHAVQFGWPEFVARIDRALDAGVGNRGGW